MQFWLTTG